MGYSGISIQALGNTGSGPATVSDVQFLRNAGIETLGVQIKPTERNDKLNLNNWQQALNDELDWALSIVQACNDPLARPIKVVIRFNDLVSNDDPSLFQVDTEAWWNDQASITRALNYWQEVCLKFVGQNIFLFEILSEPVIIDNAPPAVPPDRRKLEDFYQAALDIVRMYNSDAYFLLSPGPYGRFVQYLNGFTPFNIVDPIQPQKLMYGFHMYVEHKYTHQGVHGTPRPYFYPSPYYDITKLNQDFDAISSSAAQYGYPIYMGEFNAARWSPNAIDWVRDVILNAKQADFHWSFFAYKPNYNFWDPFFEVQDTSLPFEDWKIHYVGKGSDLWRYLITQF